MNEQNNKPNNRKLGKLGGFLRRGASRLTLGLGSSTLILAVTTAIALVAVSTVAWLTINRDVESGTSAMDINSELFELGVITKSDDETERDVDLPYKNMYYEFEDQWSPDEIQAARETARDTLAAWLSDFGIDLLETNQEDSGILCGLSVDPNSRGERKFRPGATGTLEFLIKPKTGEHLSYYATVRFDGHKKDAAGTEADYNAAKQYINGHVALFTESARTSDYLILPDTNVPFAIEDVGTSGSVYKVTLYWEWLATYDRVCALFANDMSYVNTHRADYYVSIEGYDPNKAYSTLDLSNGYNNADQLIGENIDFFAAKLQVAAGESLPENTSGSVAATVYTGA